MDPKVWAEYLAWLDAAGLLTANRQSRQPDQATAMASEAGAAGAPLKVGLDELRSGHGEGARIPLAAIPPVFTNAYLPGDA